MHIREGTLIGRYLVLEHLASGGMGEIYVARDVKLDRPAALKLLSPHIGAASRPARPPEIRGRRRRAPTPASPPASSARRAPSSPSTTRTCSPSTTSASTPA